MDRCDVRVPLFVFGTLLDRDLLARVLARDISDLKFSRGTVDGFRRTRARGESFPILVPQLGGCVEGVLIDGLSQADLTRLAFYENGYELSLVQVGAAEQTVSARFFSHTDQLADSGAAWAFETWRAFDKPLEMTAAARWMAGFQDNHAVAAPLPEAA